MACAEVNDAEKISIRNIIRWLYLFVYYGVGFASAVTAWFAPFAEKRVAFGGTIAEKGEFDGVVVMIMSPIRLG